MLAHIIISIPLPLKQTIGVRPSRASSGHLIFRQKTRDFDSPMLAVADRCRRRQTHTQLGCTMFMVFNQNQRDHMGSYYQGKAINSHKYPALITLRDVSVFWRSHLRLCSFIALFIKRERNHLPFELNTFAAVFGLLQSLVLTLCDWGPMSNVFSECYDHHITVWPLNVKYNP